MLKSRLCQLAEKYGVDKCPAIYHYYTPKYHKLLSQKNPRKFLEIGIGNHQLMSPIVGSYYEFGASLRMWREYFPDCHIYGCDILDEVIFQDERITTQLVDQSEPVSLEGMMCKFGKMDFILDDGSHIESHQKISFKTLWKYLNVGGYYIIEDIQKDRLDDMSEIGKQFSDCKIRHIHQHDRDNQGFIVFEKL
tara:strand:+ start:1164 stop:1742 length:579 start_codon:yes stop_codon:yes gene_type:complete